MPFRFNPFTGNLDEVDTTAAAGSNTQVQVNDGGKLAGFIELLWNKVTKVFTVKGDINLDDGGTFATTLQPITPTADRVISFPDATGTLALVAGSSGQLIYNNAGANAGTPTLTYDGSILTSSGRFINSYNATASSPAKTFTGTWFTGGTATTTKPHFLIEPAGTTSTAWDTRGTGLGINAPSGFPGNLLDLQVNGASKVFFGAIGTSSASPAIRIHTSSIWSPAGGTIAFGGASGGSGLHVEGGLGSGLTSGGLLWWSNNSTSAFYSQRDVVLKRDQANVLSITDGFTGAGYLKQTPVAVSALPAAATVGAGTRGFVSDSTVAASGNFGAIVTGGGSNNVPVFSDGTNWRIG